MDHLYAIRAFAKVAEVGSFVRAAEKLNISAGVMTRHIADLETHLGTRLLNRTTRKLSITEAGQKYLDRVRLILQEIDDAEAAVMAESKKPTGTLHIYSHISFGESQLVQLLKPYAKAYPGITLDITLSDRTPDLVDEGFDVGFFLSIQKFDATMIARQLGAAEVIFCASPMYIEEHGMPAVPDDLLTHSCLNFSYDHMRRWSIEGPEDKIDIPIKSNMVSNNGELLRQAAAVGMGVLARPSFSLQEDLKSGRLVRLLPDHQLGDVAVTLVYPSRRFLSAKISSFVKFISDKFPRPQSDPWKYVKP